MQYIQANAIGSSLNSLMDESVFLPRAKSYAENAL